MLIVCTQDPVIRQTAANPDNDGPAWGSVVGLVEGTREAAHARFAECLQDLGAEEPLCLSAHGNDTEIGDAWGGWTWTTREIAALLDENVSPDWKGPILIHACARTVANFSAGLALALEERGSFIELWCFGYNRPVPSNSGYPPPVGLSQRIDLHGTQVH